MISLSKRRFIWKKFVNTVVVKKLIIVFGRWCCSDNANSCLGKRKKDSQSKKGKVPNWKNGHPKGMRGKHSWNAGLTKETDERVATCGNKCSENWKKPVWSEETEIERRRKIKETAEKYHRIGGKRERSGRGKQGWYKGYWCDSSWELAFVIYNLEHEVKFERNKTGFEYEFSGKKCKYYPDFIVDNGTFIEVKGYLDEKARVKIASFNGLLKIVDKNGIKPYLEYVINKYGKDFIRLYEKEDTGVGSLNALEKHGD